MALSLVRFLLQQLQRDNLAPLGICNFVVSHPAVLSDHEKPQSCCRQMLVSRYISSFFLKVRPPPKLSSIILLQPFPQYVLPHLHKTSSCVSEVLVFCCSPPSHSTLKDSRRHVEENKLMRHHVIRSMQELATLTTSITL